jgi:crotonobetainyl-CoA:carnitine CoA-transferase CaiB-like acyl-CoA transferase
VEDAVVSAGGVATVVRTVEEWAAHPQGRASANHEIDDIAGVIEGSARPRSFGGERPLSGTRVLDLTRVIAGPTCSQVLACLGADVLRIDPPARPELLDAYLSNGMGKRSAVADLATQGEAVRELASTADVVLLGYRPGALDRFGLSPDLLFAEHRHLVIGSLSAWGEVGPWAERPGFDSIVQAATGIADLYGSSDGRPGALPVQALDHATGLSMAAHIMEHLAQGAGGIIRLSLLQTASTLLERRSPNDADLRLRVPKVKLRTPHGRIVTVPPPVLVGRKRLTAPISEYGASPLRWRDRGSDA